MHKVGELLRNPDMGRTYRRIATHGVDDFYRGEIARRIAADMKAQRRADHAGRPRRLRNRDGASRCGPPTAATAWPPTRRPAAGC